MSVARHRTDYWIKNNNVDVSVKTLNGHVDVHWHEFYEIELILSGVGTYNIDGIDYDISPGKLFLMSPSSYHYIDFDQDTEIINFMFVPDIGDMDFLYHIFNTSPHVVMNLSESDANFVYTLAKNMAKNNFVPYLSYSINCLLGKLLLLHSPEPVTLDDAQMKYKQYQLLCAHGLNEFLDTAKKLRKITAIIKTQDWYQSVGPLRDGAIPHAFAMDSRYL